MADYSWSEDDTKLLIFTNTLKVWRTNTRGDYYFIDVFSGGIAVKIGPVQDEGCQMYLLRTPLVYSYVVYNYVAYLVH